MQFAFCFYSFTSFPPLKNKDSCGPKYNLAIPLFKVYIAGDDYTILVTATATYLLLLQSKRVPVTKSNVEAHS